MIDSAAFKTVFGLGCDAPDRKCDRDRYKHLLVQAIRKSGIFPSFGGMEYAKDLIVALDLDRAVASDASLGRFVGDLRDEFKKWQE